MRYEYFLLCLVLSTSSSFANVTAEKKVIIVARSAGNPTSEPTLKPTVAPLRTSTPLPLVAEIKTTAAPTKAPAVIANEPPKLTAKATEKEVTQEAFPEALPLQTPPTNPSAPQEQALPKQANALLVTGFITENGNIYEVTDKNGIGMIEPRQNSQSESAQHVCNYGAIVIYSDVPCNEANVRIGDVHHKVVSLAHREQMPEESQQSSVVVQHMGTDKNVTNSDVDTNSADSHTNNDETAAGDVDVAQSEPPKKRRRVNKNSSSKRRRNGSRPNAVRQSSGSRRRQQAEQQQQRRRLQNNRNKSQRRRVQQQQEEEPYRRRSQYANDYGQRRRGSSNNRRRYVVYDDYDY